MFNFRELIELWRANNLLDQALGDTHKMLDDTRQMFQESVRSLRSSDEGEITLNVYEMDEKVNEYEQKVRRKVLKHLALTSGAHLIPGLILTSIVIDVERIGDYTKNIMDLARAHPKRLELGGAREVIDRAEPAVTALFNSALPAFRNSEGDTARELINDNWWILKQCDEVIDRLIEDGDEALSVSDAVTVALYARYLKRIAAHIINILSSVVNPFEAVGFHPDKGADDQ
jgi:phosphate transport system protein